MVIAVDGGRGGLCADPCHLIAEAQGEVAPAVVLVLLEELRDWRSVDGVGLEGAKLAEVHGEDERRDGADCEEDSGDPDASTLLGFGEQIDNGSAGERKDGNLSLIHI